jgi:hypothetical protein
MEEEGRKVLKRIASGDLALVDSNGAEIPRRASGLPIVKNPPHCGDGRRERRVSS